MTRRDFWRHTFLRPWIQYYILIKNISDLFITTCIRLILRNLKGLEGEGLGLGLERARKVPEICRNFNQTIFISILTNIFSHSMKRLLIAKAVPYIECVHAHLLQSANRLRCGEQNYHFGVNSIWILEWWMIILDGCWYTWCQATRLATTVRVPVVVFMLTRHPSNLTS